MLITAIGVRSIKIDRFTTAKTEFDRDNFTTTLTITTESGPLTITLASPEPIDIQDISGGRYMDDQANCSAILNQS